jgi:hypothetical protein
MQVSLVRAHAALIRRKTGAVRAGRGYPKTYKPPPGAPFQNLSGTTASVLPGPAFRTVWWALRPTPMRLQRCLARLVGQVRGALFGRAGDRLSPRAPALLGLSHLAFASMAEPKWFVPESRDRRVHLARPACEDGLSIFHRLPPVFGRSRAVESVSKNKARHLRADTERQAQVTPREVEPSDCSRSSPTPTEGVSPVDMPVEHVRADATVARTRMPAGGWPICVGSARRELGYPVTTGRLGSSRSS